MSKPQWELGTTDQSLLLLFEASSGCGPASMYPSHTYLDNFLARNIVHVGTYSACVLMVCRAVETANALYLSKKVLVTEVGSAFHAIMDLFGETRSVSSKKRIGSDMTNQAMGHLIRGRFCSALSHLMLDGLRPYRLQGIVQDDIWKVTVAFCNAGGYLRRAVYGGCWLLQCRWALKESYIWWVLSSAMPVGN